MRISTKEVCSISKGGVKLGITDKHPSRQIKPLGENKTTTIKGIYVEPSSAVLRQYTIPLLQARAFHSLYDLRVDNKQRNKQRAFRNFLQNTIGAITFCAKMGVSRPLWAMILRLPDAIRTEVIKYLASGSWVLVVG